MCADPQLAAAGDVARRVAEVSIMMMLSRSSRVAADRSTSAKPSTSGMWASVRTS